MPEIESQASTHRLKRLNFENILALALKAPGVKINRSKFLNKELIKYYPENIVQIAIDSNPAKAGISRDIINKISRSVINYETAKATGTSIAASLPSSAVAIVAAGAITADIVSYFVYILRVVQQLAYLYGFSEIEMKEDGFDVETMNYIMVFLGVMFGVQGATSALTKLAKSMHLQVAKQLAKQALMNTAIYPIVKKVATMVGIRMTKQIFADTVASSIPIMGSLLSGGLTYAMFKPCCIRLKKRLMNYDLSNPDSYITTEGKVD